MLRVFRNWKP